jgi:hypothetical protein
MKPTTHSDLVAIMEKKISTSYQVKASYQTGTKDVDFSRRTVKVIPNTFYWYDSDGDVLIKGSTTKSISERGPNSTNPGKIKNVYAHDLKVQIGKPTLMDERVEQGVNCQYAESEILSTTKGNDTLIEYQEGVIDQHSIGFRYMQNGLELVTADDADWTKWTSQLINPKDAEADGYMFIVSDIKQYEWSPVAFGANSLTPYLGVKSENKNGLALKVMERIDLLAKQLYGGKQSDEAMFWYEAETMQLKQIISELFIQGPSIKDMLLEKHRQNNTDIQEKSMRLCPKCMKSFNAPDTTSMANCPSCGQFVAASTMPVDFDLSSLNFFQNISI